MNTTMLLSGVYAAAATPLNSDLSPDTAAVPDLLSFLAGRGCHGALLLGTTGEGPSFAADERIALFRAALAVRQTHPDFRLLAGAGAPSLPETITLTRAAFELGFDGVVVLPPYYFRKASDDGLFAWFSLVLRDAVPQGGALLAYHIPAVSGVELSLELLARLKDAYPDRFAGLKDSSGNADFARQLGQRFGPDLLVLTGFDGLFDFALQNHAVGCIAALANLYSADLRCIWDAHQSGQTAPEAQQRMTARRAIMDRYPPTPAFIKALLARYADLPRWPVRPPLLPLSKEREEAATGELGRVVNE